jgi:hypothetical protein
VFQGAFLIRPDSRAPRYFLKRLERERSRRARRPDSSIANYVAIVTAGQRRGTRKIVPRGFIARIYPGFRRAVYNRKLIFPGIFRQLFRIITNGIFKGFPERRVPGYVVRWIIDFRTVLYAARYT